MKAKQTKSITKAQQHHISLSERAVDALDDGLRLIAQAVSNALAPKEAIPLFERIKTAQDAVKDLCDGMRNQLLELLKEEGEQVTDKGTLVLEKDGWILEARPQKTGLDDKRVEALLRAKGLDPEMGMDATLVYKHSDSKLNELVRLKKISKAEIETCRYDMSYSLQRPRRADA